MEYPPFEHPSGITPGYLKTLLNRFGHVNKVPLRAILEHWQGIDLSETSLYQICLVGGFLKGDWNCDFYRFLAIACGLLADVSNSQEYRIFSEKENLKILIRLLRTLSLKSYLFHFYSFYLFLFVLHINFIYNIFIFNINIYYILYLYIFYIHNISLYIIITTYIYIYISSKYIEYIDDNIVVLTIEK